MDEIEQPKAASSTSWSAASVEAFASGFGTGRQSSRTQYPNRSSSRRPTATPRREMPRRRSGGMFGVRRCAAGIVAARATGRGR